MLTESTNGSIAWSVDSLIETAIHILEDDSTTPALLPPQPDLLTLREQIKQELRDEFQQEIERARTALREEFYKALESLQPHAELPVPLRMPSGW